MKLTGKVAIVTGGAKGIGKAICKKLVAEGAKVVIADKNFEQAIVSAEEMNCNGADVIPFKIDISDISNHQVLIEQTLARYQSIDILVNNAGIQEMKTELLSVYPEVWDRVMNINIRGMFFLSQAVIPIMIKNGGGSIVNVASIVGGKRFLPNLVSYTVSKGAVRSLTKVMALALAKNNIRVNAVAPGAIDTELNMEIISVQGEKEKFVKKIPIPRLGEPEEVASAVVFLVSDCSYITGQILEIDGGRTLTC